ncbi:hypothetical protein D9619_013348 [Psilocybe cf. subviscida]|uniref:Uncharacterized protein n=1 Tax=Psilocybe cf. subviscida TaxID=2480587 RepID=A0A8H5F971_9AGAR|nr:hypothetical protein D9619_013348 [Psilocybe cf. subviscida]
MAHFPSPPSMLHYTKAHLPLISTHIKFERKPLPPKPEITHRLNLEERIRRAERVRFAATTPRSRVGGTTRARSMTPSGSSSLKATRKGKGPAIITLDELTSEPELTETESESDQVDNSGWQKIPKPAGEAGRSGSGGYSLEKALGWDKDKYTKMITWVNGKIDSKLDSSKAFTYQDQALVSKLILEGADRFDVSDRYVNNWPIREAFKIRLKMTKDTLKRKQRGAVEKTLKTVLNSEGKPS